MTSEQVKKFYEEFTPAANFIMPTDDFPVMRGKSVLIKPITATEAITDGGIILPSQSQTLKAHGHIYAVGPGVEGLKVGMKVLYNFYADQWINFKSAVYYLMYELDVFAILPEQATVGNETKPREERKQYSVDEMPDANPVPTKEEMEEIVGTAAKDAEWIKKDHTTKHYPQ